VIFAGGIIITLRVLIFSAMAVADARQLTQGKQVTPAVEP
jgi:hypothetical protein